MPNTESHNLPQTSLMRLMRGLLQTHEKVTRVGSEEVRNLGLSPVEFDCLTQLGILQPRRMCDLADCSCLTRSRTTQVITELEKRGLVRRERNARSDREVMASLTAAGQELFDRLYPAYYEFMEQTFGERLDKTEQEQMIALLNKLAKDELDSSCAC